MQGCNSAGRRAVEGISFLFGGYASLSGKKVVAMGKGLFWLGG